MNYSKSSVLIYSDASSIGAAAYSVELENKVFHRMWELSETLESSTWRELKAIELALLSFKDVFEGKVIKWFTDNQNCIRIVQSGSMNEKLHTIALSIFSTCIQKCISIDIQWVPRKQNATADYLSRLIDHEDWGVSEDFFQFMNELWGPYTADRFASSLNAKTIKFNSQFWNPGSSGVDCFTQDWSKDINWLVPPIYLVIRCIKHLIYCRAKGTLIVPRWKSAAFWPMIFGRDLTYRPYVKDVIEFKSTSGIFVKGCNKNTIFGSEPFLTPVLAVLLDAN